MLRNLLDSREPTGQDFQTKIPLIQKTIGSSLDDADLVVHALHEAQRHFVFGVAVRRDSVPMTLKSQDHRVCHEMELGSITPAIEVAAHHFVPGGVLRRLAHCGRSSGEGEVWVCLFLWWR